MRLIATLLVGIACVAGARGQNSRDAEPPRRPGERSQRMTLRSRSQTLFGNAGSRNSVSPLTVGPLRDETEFRRHPFPNRSLGTREGKIDARHSWGKFMDLCSFPW